MMNLVRWNPWREMATLQNRIDGLFDDPYFRISRDDKEFMGGWDPVVDMFEKDGNVVIKAELPGMEKKDISIDIKDRILTVKGERKHESEVKEENYYRKERSYGKFQRSFSLPSDVNSDKIQAEFKEGLLKIEIPMPEEKKPKQITVH